MKSFFIFILLLILFSCHAPEKHLTIKEFSAVLLDLHIAESLAQHIKKDSLQIGLKNQDSLLVYNAQILKNHHLSENEFKQSIQWYKSQPELLDSIYQNILTEIAIYQSKLNR